MNICMFLRLLAQIREFFSSHPTPHIHLGTSSLKVLSLVLWEDICLDIHIVFQFTRAECEFIFNPGFLGVTPWLESFIVQCLTRECAWGICASEASALCWWDCEWHGKKIFCFLSCSEWFWVYTNLVSLHDLLNPQSWLWFQEGSGLFLVVSFPGSLN